MKQIGCVIGILVLSMVAGAASADDDAGLAETLRQAVMDNLDAYNRKDVSATMESVHTKSPDYATMQDVLPNQFKVLDAQTELVGFHYIGHDDEFAVARVKFKTVGQSGEPFAANILDTITIFHLEDGGWKYWSNQVLGVQLVQ